MKKSFLFLAGLFCILLGFSQEVIYVDQDALGNNDGADWANAYTDLQTAINNSSSGDAVWVKEGVYFPQGTGRSASFNLKSGVIVLGGFAGNETQLDQRDFVNNLTILSGNIGDANLDSDNSYHVLNLSNCSGSELNGFHIQEGRATGSSYDYRGGAAHLYYSGAVTFSNCVIADNTGTYGGAICISYGGSVKFNNVIFKENSATSYGGAIHSFWSSVELSNCVFTENSSGNGILCSYNDNISWKLTNITFYGNTGGHTFDITGGGSLTAENCIIIGSITGNTACTYTYKDGTALYGEGNITENIDFIDETNPVGPDGLWFTNDDGLQLSETSPACNQGTNSVLDNLETDILGITRCNGHTVDMGAYEFDALPLFVDQTISASTYLSSGDFVGVITASDPDTEPLTFEILSGAGTYYLVDENTGNITINDISSLDDSQEHETDISMRVHDKVSFKDAMVTVHLLPQNGPNVDAGQEFSIDEDIISGASVGTITASPGDVTPISFFILNGNEDGIFSIDENSGEITIADNTDINYEAINVYSLQIVVSDGTLNSQETVTIHINDIDEAPGTSDYRIFVSQVAANSTIVGDVPAFDPESAALTYEILSGNNSGIFSINDVGQIVLERNDLLDYISVPLHQLVIDAFDGANHSSYDVTIDVEAPVNPNIVYVNKDAYGANDGSSWFNAYQDFQTAIDNSSSGDTVWVNKGYYIPQGLSRSSSFNLKSGVIVLGGFAGNEIHNKQRDFARNLTILSGNIGNEDLADDNSYHVLNLANCGGAELDGFYIQEGRATGASYDYRGGGIHLYYSGAVTFRNCVIRDNYASYGGGVCISYNGAAKFINVVFQDNSSSAYGGAIHSFYGNTQLTNCIVTENSSSNGVLCSYNSGITWQIVNTTFQGNSGSCLNVSGGGSSTVVNSIVVGSVSGSNAFTYTYKDGSVLTGEGNISGDIEFLDITNPVGIDGYWFTEDDGFQLTSESPGIDAGSADAVTEIETDILMGLRNRGANPDLGAYEFNTPPLIDVSESFSVYIYEESGTLITTFTAIDAESDMLTYSIESGNVDNAFEIGENNGELRVNNSDALDYDLNPVFHLIIEATDGAYSDTARVTLNLVKRITDITLEDATVYYNGEGQGLIATTEPDGLTIEYSYNGLETLPVNSGTYLVVVTVVDDIYEGSSSATLTIEKAPQVIVFDALEDRVYGAVPFDLSATGGSSENPIVFESTNTDVATIDGNELTMVGAGTTTITASQPGNDNYVDATPVEQILNVLKADATLTFDDATFTYDGDAKSVSFSVDPVSLTDDVVVEYFIDEAWVTASPANSGTYQARANLIHDNYSAEEQTATLLINEASQEITFAAFEDKIYGAASFELFAIGGNSGNPIVFESSNTDVATIVGNEVTIVGAGTTTITASQLGNDNYLDATPVEQTLNVLKADATLTFDDATFTYDGDAKSVSFSVDPVSLTDDVVVEYFIDEAWVTTLPVNSGTYQARANLIHDNYSDEEQTATLVINEASQEITFAAFEDKIYGAASFELFATGGNSGNPIVFESSNTDVATIVGNEVTIVGAGTTTITASQLGNDNYLDATPVEQTLNVLKADATLTFDDATFTYDGDAKSVSFSVDPVSLTDDVVVEYFIDEAWVTTLPVNSGTYQARANLIHDNYSAEEQTATLLINKASQEITFESLEDKIYGAASFELAATGGNSGNPIVFESSDTDVATIVGNEVTIVGVGTTTVTANQVGNGNYLDATPVEQTLNVISGSATITLKDATFVFDGNIKSIAFTVAPASLTNDVIVEYLVEETWSTIAPVNSGTYSVRANLIHEVYTAEEQTSVLQINKAPQVISFEDLEDKVFGDTDFEVHANGGNSGNTIKFESSNSSVATITGNIVSIKAAGTAIIKATQLGDDNYLDAKPVELLLTIHKAVPVIIEWPNASDIQEGDKLTSSVIEGGNVLTEGSFFFNNPDTVLTTGQHEVEVRFVPANQNNYTIVEGEITVNVLLVNGVEISKGPNLSVYPNPATEYITIEGIQVEKYSILNVAGEIIKQNILNDCSPINISDIKQGIYILFINDKYEVIFVKK